MQMNNIERYKLCIQCFRENGLSRFKIYNRTGLNLWIESIEKAIAECWTTDRDWFNFGMLTIGPQTNKLCPNCSYRLEHIVLAGKTLDEADDG